MEVIKRLRVEHYALINAKMGLIAWGFFYLVFPPDGPAKELGRFLITVVSLFAIIGSITAIIGLLMSTSKHVKTRKQGLTIEGAGLSIAICGPLTYCATQALLSFQEGGSNRIALTAFAYTLCAAIFGRLLTVYRHLKG